MIHSRLFNHDPARPAVIIHGGAWSIPDDFVDEHRRSLEKSLDVAIRTAIAGMPAHRIVEATIATMEDSGVFDAGCGSVLTAKGTVEMDAGIMTGSDARFGSVGAVRRLKNPIQVANLIRGDPRQEARFLVGSGAERIAEECGIELIANEQLVCERELRRYRRLQKRYEHMAKSFSVESQPVPRGTVGCVARDKMGNLAAGTSTGGTPYRPVGRIGDSPLPGSGFFASTAAGASATGWGEAIATVQLCKSACDLAKSMQASDALKNALASMGDTVKDLDNKPARGGLILLLSNGQAAWGFSTKRMARAWWNGEDQLIAV